MPWIRLSDNYVDHPKFLALSAFAFRLWHEGMAFARRHQTDGIIAAVELKGFRYFKPVHVAELTTPYREGSAPLWDTIEGLGYKIHDYLDWNLSKEEENQQKAEAKHRMTIGRDTELRNQLRVRDGGKCRYCGALVSWTDRRGSKGATYDHVNPNGPSTIDNLVIACRGCNSRKGSRTPEAAGMTLLNAPVPDLELRTDLNRIQKRPKPALDISGYGYGTDLKKKEKEEDVCRRAGRLLERYIELFLEYRKGARTRLMGNSLEFEEAVRLVETWDDDARLEKLAKIVLTTDDPWISTTDRSFSIFAKKASWADDRLRQAESGAA